VDLTAVKLVLWAQDLWCSEVESMRFSCDGESWTDWELYNTWKIFNLAQNTQVWCMTWEWNKVVYVSYKDAFGNVWPRFSGSIYLTWEECDLVMDLDADVWCTTWWIEWTVTWVWSMTVSWFDLWDIVVQNGVLWNNFLYSENPEYSWTVTTPTTWYGDTIVSIPGNIVTNIVTWAEEPVSGANWYEFDDSVSYVLNEWTDTEQIFTWIWMITICNPEDGIECITMMDRNLWAMWTGSDEYGYYYQWWNNYWFSSGGTIDTTGDKVLWDDSYDDSWYFGTVFITMDNSPYDYWSDWLNHNNLWWWWNDNEDNGYWYPMINSTDRQWPCPDWYHVPSRWEWWKILSWWASQYTWEWNTLLLNYSGALPYFENWDARSAFKNYFFLSDAWFRRYNDASIDNHTIVRLWTSSSTGDFAWSLRLNSSDVYTNKDNLRAYGFSVRCFKDEPLILAASVSEPVIETNGPSSISWWYDNVWPDIPVLMDIMPQCGTWWDISLTTSGVIDNGCNWEVEYQYCMNIEDTITWCVESEWQMWTEKEWTWLTDGIYYFFVRARDWLWNMSEWSDSVQYQVDLVWPNIIFSGISTYECIAVDRSVEAEDQWCAWTTWESYNFSGVSFWDGEWWDNLLSISGVQLSHVWNFVQYVSVKDGLWNITTTWAILTVEDSIPTLSINTWDAWILTWTYVFGNVVEELQVVDGACGTWTITASLAWVCTNAQNSVIVGNVLTIVPDVDVAGTWVCEIVFTDDELSTTTWYVEYIVVTQVPTCEIEVNDDSCTSGEVIMTIVSTWTDMYSWTWFVDMIGENTSKVVNENWVYTWYVMNNVWYTGYCSIDIDWIDNQVPVVNSTIITWYECETLVPSLEDIVSDFSIWWCDLPMTYSIDGGNYISLLVNQLNLYSWNVGTQIVSISAKDGAWNIWTGDISYTWMDRVLMINSVYDAWLVTWAIVLDDMDTIFNVTGYGSCETVAFEIWDCTNATLSLQDNEYVLTPQIGADTWDCTVIFTDWDTVQTWRILFEMTAYVPVLNFVDTSGSQINPSTWSCVDRNRFLTKMAISETSALWDFVYTMQETLSWSTNTNSYSLYDSGLLLMYNFDNVTSLWENNSLVKDMSMTRNDANVHGAAWVDNWVYWWSYAFDGLNDYISFNSISSSDYSIVMRVKPDGWEWTHVVITSGDIYINWYLSSWVENVWIDIEHGYVWRNGWYFGGQIDELRIYNRVLDIDEIQFLYRSNLARTSVHDWLFQTLNTCLAQSWEYIYEWYVKNLYWDDTSKSQWVSTCIPGVTITWWVDMDFGTYDISGVDFVVSWQYTWYIQVEDWIAKNGWIWSVRISSGFEWQDTNLTISSENFAMKNNSIVDIAHYMLWYVPESVTWLVLLSPILGNQYSTIVTYLWENQWTPYFVPNYPEWDFMCNGWIYGDLPYLQLNVPAWQPWDTYVATVYWTIEPH
jgi:hypothetical protein